MSPWLIITTGWPGPAWDVALTLARLVAQPVSVAIAAAAAVLVCSASLIKLCGRSRPGRNQSIF